MTAIEFANLSIGATFDFRNPAGSLAGATFSHRCTKVSARKYTWIEPGYAAIPSKKPPGYVTVKGATLATRIGSIHAQVFNVRCPRCDRPCNGDLARDSRGCLSCILCAVV